MSIVEFYSLIVLAICSLFLLLKQRSQIIFFFTKQKQKFQILKSALSEKNISSIDNENSREKYFSKFFLPLAPTSNADDDGKYSEALNWALQKDDIFNIAITGPYGAGKTSVLKTFFLRHKYNYLSVSLAKFSQSYDKDNNHQEQTGEKFIETGDDISTNSDNLSPDSHTDYSDEANGFLLEKSILQQILYAEEQKKLPYSRFARVYHLSLWHKLSLAIPSLFLVLVIFSYIFEKEWFKSSIHTLNSSSEWVYLPIYAITFFAFVWLLISMFDFFRNLTIDKVNLFSGDFQFSESHGASALNIHLDELIYFFEVTNYRVVIFEDLDRFSNTSIFTKLREMNTLINNSQQVRKKPNWFRELFKYKNDYEPVRFIYAVKDELFSDAMDRTKFFDFVLPIIPYVSDQNSRQLLLDKLRDIGKLDDYSECTKWKNFVRDITLYVDDMRLLINIFNEFLVYEAKLLGGFKNTDARLLFAFILYKNKYPKDFSDLYKGHGHIQHAFNNKRNLVSQKIKSAEQKVKNIEAEIEKINHEITESSTELRTLLLGSIIYTDKAAPLEIHNGSHWETMSDYIESEEKFESLFTLNKVHFRKSNTTQLNLTNNDVFGSKGINYKQRKKLVEQRKIVKIVSLRQDIKRLNKKQQDLRLFSLAELLEDSELDSEDVFESRGSLLELLIRKGYIDESFSHYLNIFHDGDLSRADKDFVFSVKSKGRLPYENQIQNVEVVLEELDEADFKVDAVLNYQLIEHLISNNASDSRLAHVFKTLSENHDKHAQFIEDFLRTSSMSREFAVQFAKTWSDFWSLVCLPLTDDNLKAELANELIYSLDIQRLSDINIEDAFIEYIKNHITVFADFKKISQEKVIKLLNEFKFVFSDLTEFLSIYPNLINTILELDAYEINVTNLQHLYKTLSHKGDDNLPNYNELTSLDSRIEAYLEANQQQYIINYLLLGDGIIESVKTLEAFLLNNNINVSAKESLINNIDFQLSHIDSVEDKSLWKLLLGEQRVKPSWKNVLILFRNDDKPYRQTIEFIEENLDELCECDLDEKIYHDELGFSQDLNEFLLPLIYFEHTSITTIDKILGLHGYFLSDINFSKLPLDVINLLIDREYIQLSSDYIEQISIVSPECAIKFILNNFQEFSNLEAAPILKTAILIGVVVSKKLSDSDVIHTLTSQLTNVPSGLILSGDQSKLLYDALKKRKQLNLSADLLISLLLVISIHSIKLKLINQQLPNLVSEDISRCLKTMGLKKISDAYEKGTNVAINVELLSDKLLENLKHKGYISSYFEKKGKFRIYFYAS